MEESADAKELKLGKIQEELFSLKFRVQDMDEQLRKLQKSIEAKTMEIDLAATAGEGEGEGDGQPAKSVSELTKVIYSYVILCSYYFLLSFF